MKDNIKHDKDGQLHQRRAQVAARAGTLKSDMADQLKKEIKCPNQLY